MSSFSSRQSFPKLRLAALSDSGRRLPGAVPAVAFVLVVAVFANPLFLRRNFGGRDLLVHNLATKKVVHDAWARGRIPVWNPWISRGAPACRESERRHALSRSRGLRTAAVPRLVTNWRERVGGVPVLNAIGHLDPGEVVVESGRTGRGAVPAGDVRILGKTAERLEIETRVLEAGWLFVLRGYWPYRTVAVDGRAATVVPAQGAFSALAVQRGVHRVVWRERLAGGTASRGEPVLFVLFCALVLRGRRKVSNAERPRP